MSDSENLGIIVQINHLTFYQAYFILYYKIQIQENLQFDSFWTYYTGNVILLAALILV